MRLRKLSLEEVAYDVLCEKIELQADTECSEESS